MRGAHSARSIRSSAKQNYSRLLVEPQHGGVHLHRLERIALGLLSKLHNPAFLKMSFLSEIAECAQRGVGECAQRRG